MRKLPWEEKGQKQEPPKPATSRPIKPAAAVCSDLMIVGSHHDDKYIMVEDELVDIVGIILRDTHRSEYQRRAIELAGIKGKSIERPTIDVPAQKEVFGRSTCNDEDEDESDDANETRDLLDMLRQPNLEKEGRICNRPSAIRKPVDPDELEVKTCVSAKPGIQCLTKQDCSGEYPSTRRQRKDSSPESVRKFPRDWSTRRKHAPKADDITAFLFGDAPRLPTPLKPRIKRTTSAILENDEGGGKEKKKKKRSLLDELSWLS